MTNIPKLFAIPYLKLKQVIRRGSGGRWDGAGGKGVNLAALASVQWGLLGTSAVTHPGEAGHPGHPEPGEEGPTPAMGLNCGDPLALLGWGEPSEDGLHACPSAVRASFERASSSSTACRIFSA